jgi:dCMP deaminase
MSTPSTADEEKTPDPKPPKPSSRPTWQETRIAMARELAKRSLCVRDRVGALIVDKDDKIIGEGYNGPARYTNHDQRPCTDWCPRAKMKNPEVLIAGYDNCPSLHAEANALMASDRSLRVGGIIYITSHPCLACAKLISNSGLTGVYVGHDGQHEYRRDSSVYRYLMDLGIRVWEVLVEPR